MCKYVQENSRLRVRGFDYKVAPIYQLIVDLIRCIQAVYIIYICYRWFNQPVPREGTNKFANQIMITFFIGNFISGSLLKSGAFEIYLGNELVWSKLATGQLPSVHDLIAILEH
eukprot:GHVL01010582.1.p1 GENE.GHVL01010582.1~~GHVL01010582.1.p1  ORF type:complete len:114 (+),score=4.61 GHVL01010582.1:375-716(+)